MKTTLVSVYFTFVVLLFAACSVREVFSELPVTSIIRGYGYPCVEYSAITPDGYVLAMQRIPHGINNQRATKGVVLFQHGLTDNANGAVLNNPQESLPFILADNGYDVWLGNNRGNGYSMTSTKWNSNQAQFWQFSFDEMASMDLPTEIDFALKTSGAKKLSYIGHSEGTIQAFAGFENATVASKVNIFIALAPVAYVHHQESLILKALALLDTGEVLALLGDHEFYLPSVLHKLLPDACIISPQACAFIVEFVAGPSQNLNDSRLSYYLDYEPNPTSVFNMIHWSQMVKAEAFQMFDYGRQGNIDHYGQPTPPQYDLGKVTLPVALFTGSNDYLADPEDVERLIGELPTPPVLVHNEPTYAHLDPLLAPSARTKIYPLVLNLLAKYSSAF